MRLKTVYLSLGSNLGDREANISRALARLEDVGVHVNARSSLYETAPRDVIDQPWFVNIAVQCETALFPIQLMGALQKIERESGRMRTRAVARGPRTLDIDVLLYGSALIDTPQLTVPHPRMLERRFVLEPLLEIAPDLRHPVTKLPLRRYLGAVADQRVHKLNLSTNLRSRDPAVP